jgi:hypothetical protein
MTIRERLTLMIQPLVVSFGGGVNSAAMLVGMHERNICPDLILFSDTGGEKPETYQFIPVMNQWCLARGFPEIVCVSVADNPKAIDKTLENNCLRLKFLPSIVYGFKKCSQRWKADPQDRYLNHWALARKCWEAGLKIRKAIGFDIDEGHRELQGDDKSEFVFPLRDWKWGRAECIQALVRAKLPVPPKSACFFCPSSRKSEVLNLKRDHPDLFARAVEMEHNAAEGMTTIKGLGRHWSWKQIGEADEAQFKMFPETVEIPCMCFDGEGEQGGFAENH